MINRRAVVLRNARGSRMPTSESRDPKIRRNVSWAVSAAFCGQRSLRRSHVNNHP
ncbi:hypothetical protein D3C80_2149040 [compost metagenome]